MNVLDAPGTRRDADVMASAHVLVIDVPPNRVLSRELFDYAFARLWTSRQQSLVEFLVSGEQGLFRRAQVRQVLVFLRQSDPPRYMRELGGAAHGRPGALPRQARGPGVAARDARSDARRADPCCGASCPGEPEWAGQIELLLRTTQWFDLIDSEGLIEAWLDQPTLAPRALELMLGAAKDRPARIAGSIGARTSKADFPNWFRWLGRWAPFEADRGLFELLLTSVRARI